MVSKRNSSGAMVSLLSIGAGVGVLSVASKLIVKLTSARCDCTTQLAGKTVLITGGNAGIGKATALELARKGARVIIASRNVEKSEQVRDEIIDQTGNPNVEVKYLNLGSLASVRKFAEDFLATESRLDVLINNAACMTVPGKRSKDGLEINLEVNHLGPFLLTNLLLDLLKKSAPSRIIMVSSKAHMYAAKGFNLEDLSDQLVESRVKSGFQVYAICKLCNMLMVNELDTRLQGTGVTVNGLHPGVIYTDIWNGLPRFVGLLVWPFSQTESEGAQTTIHLAVSPDLQETSGKYFADCKETPASEQARDSKLARIVWDTSARMVGLEDKSKLYLLAMKKSAKTESNRTAAIPVII